MPVLRSSELRRSRHTLKASPKRVSPWNTLVRKRTVAIGIHIDKKKRRCRSISATVATHSHIALNHHVTPEGSNFRARATTHHIASTPLPSVRHHDKRRAADLLVFRLLERAEATQQSRCLPKVVTDYTSRDVT